MHVTFVMCMFRSNSRDDRRLQFCKGKGKLKKDKKRVNVRNTRKLRGCEWFACKNADLLD